MTPTDPAEPLTPSQRAFIEQHPSAAMITIAGDGTPRPVRVAVAFVDGKLWSSGTADRVRTARLRHDPRCVLVQRAGLVCSTRPSSAGIR